MSKKTALGNPQWILFGALILLVLASFIPEYDFGFFQTKTFHLFEDIKKDPIEEAELIADIENEVVEPKSDNQTTTTPSNPPKEVITNRVGDNIIFEDYSAEGNGLKNLKHAITHNSSLGRPARIAFVGDSYIEGDIFTEAIRAELQKKYGGKGVGYVSMYSTFPGFRHSVKQGGKDWKNRSVITPKEFQNKYMTLSQAYEVSQPSSTSSYKGSSKKYGQNSWESSKFLFISHHDAEIRTKTNGDWVAHTVSGSNDVQTIEVDEATSEFYVSTSTPDIIGLGVWLDGKSGVSLDCYSTRGSSGMNLRQINTDLANKISDEVKYDLIVLEFGLNVMTAKQKKYDSYTHNMIQAVEHLKKCYPHSDILLMGIGDRGEKRAGKEGSLPVVPYMIKAQRAIAEKTGILFWDTCEAMGGPGSVVDWVNNNPPRINKDYTHLSHAGGEFLSKKFIYALEHSIEK